MPSIRDFSGGVLNQELQNRDTGAGVLFDCKNVLSSWNGELRKRTGTRWLRSLNNNSKLIPYHLPDGDDMILCLGNGVINCYTFNSEGNLIPYTVGDESTNMFPEYNTWESNTNGDWTVGSTYTGDFYPAFNRLGKNITVDYDSTGNCIMYFSNTETGMIFKSLHVNWTCSARNAQIYRYEADPVIQYSDDNENWTPVQTEISELDQWFIRNRINPQTILYSSVTQYDIYNNFNIEVHPYWRIIFRETVKTGIIIGESANLQWNLLITNVNCWTSATANPLVFDNCPYTEEDFNNIRWSQNGTELTMVSKGKLPYQIKPQSGSLAGSTFTPSDVSTIWENYGKPSCVVYYQNRLWFAGFENNPTMVWSSKFGDFSSFNVPTPGNIQSTSPIQATGTEITYPIENMFGGNNALYCLSADGISMIDAQGAIVATDQVEFKLRNREPVDSMVPTVKDDIMIYLGRDKRKILLTDYDFVVQRFKASCVSDNYNNFLKSGIKELHYIPRKSSLLYGVLEDGKWFAQLFSLEKAKNSLFPFETNGKILDLQPIKKGKETKLLMVTHLPSFQYIIEEKLPQPDQEIMDFMDTEQQQEYTRQVIDGQEAYLDHSIRMLLEEPSAILHDVPYLKDEQIEVIADGQYLGTKIVLQNEDTGECYVSLDEPVSKAILGYKYPSYAVLKFVTPYTERKFPKEIAVNFINTGYLEVGNTFNSLKSVLNNLVETVSINGKRILMNGNYAKTLDKHSFETPYVIVYSDKGLPFIITGIDYRVDMSNYQGGV